MKSAKATAFLILVMISIGLGTVFVASAQNTKPVPTVMYGFLQHILDLQPFLYEEERFVSDKNQKEIQDHLDRLAEMSVQLKKHERLKTPGFQIPASVLVQQLREVQQTFRENHRSYAWRSLRSALHSCGQCHTQVSDATRKVPTWDLSTLDLPKDPYERADFYFMIRSYDNAMDEYKKVIESYGKDHRDPFLLRRALRHVLTVTLKTRHSPQQGLEALGQLKIKEPLPTNISEEIQLWKSEMERLKALQTPDVKTVSVSDFENFVEDLFRAVYPIPRKGRSEVVVAEYASGILSEFVNSRPKDTTQAMYYWLGVSTISLNRMEMNSYGDLYLKKCIEGFPPSITSHECFTALEENWMFGYSGSAGTFLPKSHRDELNRLQKLIGPSSEKP